MRIKINFYGTDENVPMALQHKVLGTFHKALGANNEYHDAKSDYCLSDLRGGKYKNGSLSFTKGAFIIISSTDPDLIERIVNGYTNPENNISIYGMKYKNFEIVKEEKFYDGINHFRTLSPIMLRVIDDKGKSRYLTIDDEDFVKILTERTIAKLKITHPHLNTSNFSISIPDRPFNKRKRVFINDVPNFVSLCQLDIECSKEVAEVLYNFGIGQSTGAGFGTICKTENKDYYQVKE